MFDTGSSTGDIIGHSKTVNAVSIRRQRPFRAVTASDDVTIAFHHGKSNHPFNPDFGLRFSDPGIPFKYASVSPITMFGAFRARFS